MKKTFRTFAALALCVFLSGAHAQIGLPFPGPGTAHSSGGGGRTCSDDTASTNFLARTSGLSSAQQDRACNLIKTLEAGGIITGNLSGANGCGTVLDFFHFTVTNTTTTANLNLCGTNFTLSATAAPTFTANAGYVANGTTQFLNVNFNPSTQGVNVTANSNSLGVYIGNDRAPIANSTDIGGGNNPPYMYLNALDIQGGGAVNTELNGATFPFFTLATATPRGCTTVTRDATTLSAFKNNSATALGTVADTAGALPNASLFLLAFDTVGTGAVNFAPDTLYADYGGANLTGAQHVTICNAINTALTPLGLNAY